LKEIPDFPADFKTEAASLYQRLDHFRTSATYPQTITYCSTEIPAYFLLNQMSKFVEKIKTRKYEDAVTLSQKTFTQVAENQIVDPYKPIYATFKNYKELAEDFQSQFLSRLAKLKQSETDYTDTELLAEYQKLYDMVPDPKVAARMEQIRAKLNTR